MFLVCAFLTHSVGILGHLRHQYLNPVNSTACFPVVVTWLNIFPVASFSSGKGDERTSVTTTDNGAQRNLAALRLPELRKIAAEMGLKGTSALRKGDLIAAISGAQGERLHKADVVPHLQQSTRHKQNLRQRWRRILHL